MKYFFLYLCIVNAAGFLLMLADKIKAKNHKWRIPERTLILSAIIGGSVGVFAGMHLFRHKTKHLQFSVGIPLIVAVQVIGFVVWYCRLM